MSKPQTRIFFRADGNSTMGLGHVYRSCALAAMLSDHFTCHFIIRKPLPALEGMIAEYCEALIKLPEEPESIVGEAAFIATLLTAQDILVLDGYHFDTAYQATIKENAGCTLVCIDDIHAYPFIADAVVSHIGGLVPQDYKAACYTEFYLGLRYALVRKDFLKQQIADPVAGREKKLLLFLGGSDPANDTLKVLQQIPQGLFEEIHIITGAGYKYINPLEAYIAAGRPDIHHHNNIAVTEVVGIMLACGTALLAPSSVSYEYMSVGGVVFLYQIADNQSEVFKYYIEHGLAESFANFRLPDTALTSHMAEAQRRYFDGKSPDRLLRMFQGLDTAAGMVTRNAMGEDVKIAYDWANEEQTRAMSYNTVPIIYEQHESWFAKRTAGGAPHYYILELRGKPFAQIRFEQEETERTFMLGFVIAKDYRGKGFGSKVLAAGMKQLKIDLGDMPVTVTGYVKKSNSASAVSFERLGFAREETVKYPESFKYTIKI